MHIRRALLLVPVVVAALLASPSAHSAEPASGTVDHETPEVSWTGAVPIQTVALSGVGCDEGTTRHTCDTFTLTVGELAGTDADGNAFDDDVLVAIGAPDVEPGTIAEFDLYVYGPDGALVGSDTNLGSNDTVTLHQPEAGDYVVAVQSPLQSDPTAEYAGRAQVVDAGDEASVDLETACGLETAPGPVRDAEAATGQGLAGVAGDPLATTDGVDRGEPVDLDVLVYLDGVTEDEADAIFAIAAEQAYGSLNINIRAAEYRTHSFGTDNGMAIIRQTKELVGGVRPEGVDIVEALVGHDIQQLNQYPIAGIADCIGGVAHDDRAFLVAEAHVPGDILVGPLMLVPDPAAHVTAHEIGHLMGGQHHYANCVEGVDATDVHDDHVEVSPCTLMFNSADFMGGDFDTLNGAVVRGHASRYARP